MKEISLTQGKVALVDDSDYEWLNQWKWRANGHGNWLYAIRNFKISKGKKKVIKMHRLILGLTDSNILCDHKDGNRLNNQRSNLRVATYSQNQANRKSRIGISGHLGVFKSGNKWLARIREPKKDKQYLGTFDTKEEAALAYNKAALEIHGEFANLNIIETSSDIPRTTNQGNGRQGSRL